MNLETITTILVEEAETLRKRNTLDLSMFPEADIPKIYAAAAEGTLQKRDFKATGHYLYLGKQWEILLKLGVPFFHSQDEEERKAGRHFLEILAWHDMLPENAAIELADDILEYDGEHSRYLAARVLAAGKARERAKQIAYRFFNEGNPEDGRPFLEVTGKKLTTDEVARFAEIALRHGKHKETFELYKSQSLQIPKDQAKAIAHGDLREWLLNLVIEYMDKTKNSFTPDEFKELAGGIFAAGDHNEALTLYTRAGKLVSAEDYRTRGEQILSQVKEIESSRSSYSPGIVWPTVSTAFTYLFRSDPKKAKQRIAQYADALLDQPDFAKISSNVEAFGKIYEMLEIPIPVDKALKAARMSEEKGKYGEAAKFYAAAGMNDVAKRMGYLALKSDNGWEREYGSMNAFTVARDNDGQAVVRFIEKNLRTF